MVGDQQASQQLGDAPRLRDAAAGAIRLLGIEHLADIADAVFPEVREEPVERSPRARDFAAMKLFPDDIVCCGPAPAFVHGSRA